MHTQKRNIVTLVLLLCCAAGFAQRTALTAGESAALKAKITANTRSMQSLQSDFAQTRQLSYLESPIRSTGKLYFKAPGKIRWEYMSPASHVIIFDGHTMHTIENGRTKTTNLATNRQMKGLNDLLAASVQGGNMLDESRFDITYYRDKSNYAAVLVPKDKGLGRYIQQVELTFDRTTLLLTEVTLTDPAGDSTELAFANQQKNTSVPDATFEP